MADQTGKAELVLQNCRLVESGGSIGPLSDIGIRGETITATAPAGSLGGTAKETLDCEGGIAIPGLVNTHCHSPMTLFRGLADDLPLMTWLNEHIFPAEARLVKPDMVYACSLLAGVEMLTAGITTVADAYFHEKEAARALADAGMQVIAAQGIIDFPAPGVPDPGKNIEAATEFIDSFNIPGRTRPALFCHSPYTCSPNTLKAAKKLSRDRGCLFFIHLAETAAEVETVKREHGTTPARYLEKLKILDADTVLVHCVHLDDEEIGLIAASGAAVSLCPRSNMKLASGIPPADRLLAAGIRTGLGTDGSASNNLLDILLEMDMLAKLVKANRLDAAAIRAEEIFHLGAAGGAAVLGLDDVTGRIAPGMAADIAVVDAGLPRLTPAYNGHSLMVYSADGGCVRHVVAGGEIVVRERKPVRVNLDAVLAEVGELAIRSGLAAVR